jgi:hypothetical protein
MFARIRAAAVLTPLVLSLTVAGVRADDPLPLHPLSKQVFYKIHDDPGDPNSAVIFTIELSLQEADSDGDSIGWEIAEIRFCQPGQGGGGDTYWVESDPNVPSGDGLWWIDHASYHYPELEEFAEPPHLVGTATAQDPNDGDLGYDFEGVAYTPPPRGAPWDPTGALDYAFTVVGGPPPVPDGDDEPAEIEDQEDPPA